MQRANGSWHAILGELGIPSQLLTGKHQPCPFCGGKDRFRFTDKNRDGMYYCSQCGTGNGITFLMKFHGWDFRTAAGHVDKIAGMGPKPSVSKRSTSLRSASDTLWASATPISAGDPAGRYLTSRLGILEYPETLRFVSNLYCHADAGEPSYCPCLLARLTTPDGQPDLVHRTYLAAGGRKAQIERPKRLMAGEVTPGSAIRLAPHGDELGIAEGTETAISAGILHGIPTWSAVSAALLRNWIAPPDLKRVIVFGDNDANFVGQTAAHELAKRLKAERPRLEVEIKIPERTGDDWADVWHARILSPAAA
jgi:putative DNA primase/helicase